MPDTLDWDLWLGSAEKRPYTSGGKGYPNKYGNFYQPFNWRGFFDFGCGSLGDMACHILGAPNLALSLGSPTSVECIHKEGVSDFQFPKTSTIRYDFPARGNMPPVKVFWHDAMKATPKLDGVPEGELLGDLPSRPRPQGQPAPPPVRSGYIGRVFDWDNFQQNSLAPDAKTPDPNGSLFIGTKGMLTTGTYGEQTRLIPVAKNAGLPLPPTPAHALARPLSATGFAPAKVATPPVPTSTWPLRSSSGCCSASSPYASKASSNGTPPGRFTNNADANKYLKPAFRKGWTLS